MELTAQGVAGLSSRVNSNGKFFNICGATGPEHIYVSTAEEDLVVEHVLTGRGYIILCSGHNTGKRTVAKAIERSQRLIARGIKAVYVELEAEQPDISEADFWKKLFALMACHPHGIRFNESEMKELLQDELATPSAYTFEVLCGLQELPILLLILNNASAIGDMNRAVMHDFVAAVRSLQNNPDIKFGGVIFLGVLSVLNVVSTYTRHINFTVGDVGAEDVCTKAGNGSSSGACDSCSRKKPRLCWGDAFCGGASSPFRPKAVLDIKNFSFDQVCSLLKQLQLALAARGCRNMLTDDRARTAATIIHMITCGKRGYVGHFCKYLEEFMSQDSDPTENWDILVRRILSEKASHSAAFNTITNALNYAYPGGKLASTHQQWERWVLEHALVQGVVRIPYADVPAMLMQQGVLVIYDDENREVDNAAWRLVHGTSRFVRLAPAAPFVSSSMLLPMRWVSLSDELKIADGPDKLTTDWLLQKVVQHLHMDTLLAEEALNPDTKQLSAYACKAQCLVIINTVIKELSAQGKEGYKYRVVPEACNLTVQDNSSQWPDILLTADHLPTIAFRMVACASVHTIEHEQQQQSTWLAQEQECQAVVVNFLLCDDDCDEVGSDIYFPSSNLPAIVRNVVLPRKQGARQAKIYFGNCQCKTITLFNPVGSGELNLSLCTV